jgi:hypothetical protein
VEKKKEQKKEEKRKKKRKGHKIEKERKKKGKIENEEKKKKEKKNKKTDDEKEEKKNVKYKIKRKRRYVHKTTETAPNEIFINDRVYEPNDLPFFSKTLFLKFASDIIKNEVQEKKSRQEKGSLFNNTDELNE